MISGRHCELFSFENSGCPELHRCQSVLVLADTLCAWATAAKHCADAGCWRELRPGCQALLGCLWWTAGAACRHLASSEGSYKVSEWLLCEEGADVNALDRFQRTPLEVVLCCYLRSASVTECHWQLPEPGTVWPGTVWLGTVGPSQQPTHHQPFHACCTAVSHHSLCLQPARIGTLLILSAALPLLCTLMLCRMQCGATSMSSANCSLTTGPKSGMTAR